MIWEWVSSAEQSLRGTSLATWALLAVAGILGVLLPVALLRTERTFANGLLAALTFAALAVAITTQFKKAPPDPPIAERSPGFTLTSAVPALACIHDMAGEAALGACERVLFGAPDTVAAAVVYASALLNRLTSRDDVAAAGREMTPQLSALRRAVERDRYGIFAYVLASRDNCRPESCGAYAAMTDHRQVAANMNDLIYEGLVSRYAPTWNAAVPPPMPSAQIALSSGRPSTVDFPTAASIPPVNIMSAEPPSGASPNTGSAELPAAAPAGANNALASERSGAREGARKTPGSSRSDNPTSPNSREKRQRGPKQSTSPEAEGPVQLTPADR